MAVLELEDDGSGEGVMLLVGVRLAVRVLDAVDEGTAVLVVLTAGVFEGCLLVEGEEVCEGTTDTEVELLGEGTTDIEVELVGEAPRELEGSGLTLKDMLLEIDDVREMLLLREVDGVNDTAGVFEAAGEGDVDAVSLIDFVLEAAEVTEANGVLEVVELKDLELEREGSDEREDVTVEVDVGEYEIVGEVVELNDGGRHPPVTY